MKLYNERLQFVQSRMNHHVHPVANAATGERRPLHSCCKKCQPKLCKAGSPLESAMIPRALVVCVCIADMFNLCKNGPRSLLGTILPERNDPWLNAGPAAWLIFAGDNADIKFPHRFPIIPQTHENLLLFDVTGNKTCCGLVPTLDLCHDLQASQAVAGGYFGGYSAKIARHRAEGTPAFARGSGP